MSIGMFFAGTIRAQATRRFAFALSSFVFVALAALPALAQQQQAGPNVPSAPFGYGHMMGGGPWGWHGGGPGWYPFMIVGPIFALLAIIGLMAIFVWLVRWATRGHPFYGHGFRYAHGGCPWCGSPGRGRAALDVLEERFARGEIDKAEFEEKRKLLGRS
jgi:putative membrane protein